MGISSVGSFQVQSGGSLTKLPVPLGVAKLAFNRQTFIHALGVALLSLTD